MQVNVMAPDTAPAAIQSTDKLPASFIAIKITRAKTPIPAAPPISVEKTTRSGKGIEPKPGHLAARLITRGLRINAGMYVGHKGTVMSP